MEEKGMLPLHSYQKKAIEAIEHSVGTGLALWLPMGMGKSRIILSYLKKNGRPKTLVIAPASVVRNVWKQQAQIWDKDARVQLIVGTPSKRLAMLDEDADIYVISRDLMKWLYGLNLKRKWDVLVVDESTSFKNPSSIRFRCLKKMIRNFKQRILLSGTPNANSYIDLWAQYYLLDFGARLGRYVTYYKQDYFVGFLINGYMVYKMPKDGAIKAINDKVKDITFALSADDWLKLPDTIYNTIAIEQTDKERKAYMEMKKNYVCCKVITAVNAATLCNKLQQLSNGWAYTDDHKVIPFGDSKLEALKEIVDVSTENILVYFTYEEDRKRLKEIGGYEIKTEKDIEKWNDGKIPFAIANPASLGYGLNLQYGGHQVIWYSPIWNAELYSQANGRLARQGQMHPVTITHLITKDTIDEKIMTALHTKELDMQALIDAVKWEVGDVS